jgi:hypothetical protein
MTYEVQHFTLCDGWVNTWFAYAEDGSCEPETFATEAEAQAALDEFFAEIEEEIAAGERGADEGYEPDEFRIVEVGAA